MSDAVKGASLYSPCFWTALAALHTHGVADAHAGLAQALWTDLATRLPSEPDLSVDEGVKFVWMSDRYTLEVEVLSDGRKTWYFRDAELPAGQSEGATVADLPERFWECLTLAARSLPSRAMLLCEAEYRWLKHATRLGRSNVYDPREVEAVAAMLAGLGAVRGGRPPRRKVTPERG